MPRIGMHRSRRQPDLDKKARQQAAKQAARERQSMLPKIADVEPPIWSPWAPEAMPRRGSAPRRRWHTAEQNPAELHRRPDSHSHEVQIATTSKATMPVRAGQRLPVIVSSGEQPARMSSILEPMLLRISPPGQVPAPR